MEKKLDFTTITDYLNADKYNFYKLFESHPEYPSIISFYDVFKDLNISSPVLKISYGEINKLPNKFIAPLQDETGDFFLTFIERKKENFHFKKNESQVELKNDQFDEVWLGMVLLIEEEELCKTNWDTKSSNALPKKNIIIPTNKDYIIGLDNIFIDKGAPGNISINIIGNNNRIIFEEGSKLLNCNLYCRGNNNLLKIKKNCRISNVDFRLENSNSLIKIDEYTTIESANISATESKSIKIGKDCMFADKISIRTSDSHSIIDLKLNKRINQAGDIIIENHVWIGSSVTILKGVRIESSSIIGIGSIVTKNISSNTIAVGIPAKVNKTNVNWDRKLI